MPATTVDLATASLRRKTFLVLEAYFILGPIPSTSQSTVTLRRKTPEPTLATNIMTVTPQLRRGCVRLLTVNNHTRPPVTSATATHPWLATGSSINSWLLKTKTAEVQAVLP
eukprot:PhF_6_TR14334/c1_g1_i1/m.22985